VGGNWWVVIGGWFDHIYYICDQLVEFGWLVGGYEIDDLFFFLFVSIT